ncbi:MAG: hypothetical protein L0H84_01520 [Pseudonocardia sp.]|nr:hypothetical protein [Pseudonocardia sp.]
MALAVVALLIGGGAGYALRSLTVTEPAPPPPTVAAAPAPTPPTPALSTSCAEAADAGAVLVEQLRQGVAAIGNLDPGALSDVLDRMQQQQRRLEAAVRACSASPACAGGG